MKIDRMKNVLYTCILLLGWQNLLFSATFYVNDNSNVNDIYCTAVGNNANPGTSAAPFATLSYVVNTIGLFPNDIVYIDAGIYYQTDANLNFNVNDITIIGAGYDYTIFDHDFGGGDFERWGNITADGYSLTGVSITGYDYGVGGACALQISGASNVTITNVMVNENDPGGGSSAIVVDGGSTVDFIGGGSKCNPGQATIAGGGANVEGNGNTVTFTDYTFASNGKNAQGGSGLYVSGDNTTSVTVTNSKFEGNQNGSVEGGGAIFVSGSNVSLTGTCFTGNYASYNFGPVYGGAICVARGATLNVTDCTFSGNYAQTSGKGGAIGVNTTFSGSGTTATVNVTSCAFNLNSSGEAADLYARVGSGNAAIFNVNNCTFSGTALDIRDDNSAQINIQNSGIPNASGSGINLINTTAASGSPATNCPIAPAQCFLVLPVELVDFSGICVDDGIILTWQTATELNNDYFILEHSTANENFQKVGIVQGQINSNELTSYAFTDQRFTGGINYYRLIQVDMDGRNEIYPSISVKDNCAPSSLSVNFSSDLNSLIFSEETYGVTEISVLNTSGKLIEHIVLDRFETYKELQINSSLSTGMYLISFLKNEKVFTNKILITK